MKCPACQYEYKVDYTNKENSIGDEDFVRISGEFFIVSGYYGDINKKVGLYGCPKCQLIKFSEYGE